MFAPVVTYSGEGASFRLFQVTVNFIGIDNKDSCEFACNTATLAAGAQASTIGIPQPISRSTCIGANAVDAQRLGCRSTSVEDGLRVYMWSQAVNGSFACNYVAMPPQAPTCSVVFQPEQTSSLPPSSFQVVRIFHFILVFQCCYCCLTCF